MRLVIGTNGGSAFKVFTRAELDACQVLGDRYFCPNLNILDKRIKTNCVLGLFNRDQEVITAHCPWISIAATDFNIQLGANRFLLYLANWFAAKNRQLKNFMDSSN
jgi:hypothetical protein